MNDSDYVDVRVNPRERNPNLVLEEIHHTDVDSGDIKLPRDLYQRCILAQIEYDECQALIQKYLDWRPQ